MNIASFEILKPFLILAFALFGFFTILLIIKKLIKKSSPKEEDFPYMKVESLMTEAERKFFFVLSEIVGNDYLIFSKVRLADLLTLPKSMSNSDFHRYFNKIKSKHVDFVICDKKTTKPLLVIELDDSSHGRSDRILRDEFIDIIFRKIEIKLMRIENFSCNKNKLRDKIYSLICSH